MASSDLQEKANFTRLSRLLIEKGTEALRITVDASLPPPNLSAVLNANRTSLLKLKPRVINSSQWDLLFPPSGVPPDSRNFDVTLLTVLLRNICSLPPPATGWNTMPPNTDRSPQANIVRIKLFRNQIYAHVTSTKVDDATFESLWQKITQALVELNIPQNDVDDLKTSPLGPEEEIYLGILEGWKLQEEGSIKMLQAIGTSVNNLTKITKEICDEKDNDLLRKLAKHNFKSKIRGKVKLFQPGTREWLFSKVDEWFIKNEDESRILLLTAGPGFGKSVFAAKVCEDFKKKGNFAACHFCDFSDSNLRDPMMMLQSLASHMCDTIVGFKEKLLDQVKRPHQVRSLKDVFGIYLQNPLDELEVAEPYLVVIDGLDESAADDKNEIVNLIADYFPDLPKCVKVLITSRPEISVAKLSDLQKVAIESNDAKNDLDLELYLKSCLPNLAEVKADSAVCDILVSQCEGSFLYAFHLQSELQKLDTDDLERIPFIAIGDAKEFLPKGLDSIYQVYFKRLEDELKVIVHDKVNILKILELLVASNGHLPLKFLTRGLGLASDCRETKQIINQVNETVSCLLYVSDDLVTIFHKSVIDWLCARGYEDHEFTVKTYEARKSLWLICEETFEEIKRTVRSRNDLNVTNEVKYAMEHGLQQLVVCRMEESFYWLVDVVIVHTISTFYPNNPWIIKRLLDLLKYVLFEDFVISDELRARIVWHVLEIDFLERKVMSTADILFISPRFCYLQSVLSHSPEGYFSDDEKGIAMSLLLKERRFVEENCHEVEFIPVAFRDLSRNIRAVGVSCDKTLAAVVRKNGKISVLSALTLVELWQCSVQCKSTSCCTFSPDNSFILFGKLETAINIAERKKVPFFHGHQEDFTSCAFSCNGRRLVTSNGSSTVKLWDVANQSLLSILCAQLPVSRCSFSTTGLLISAESKFAADDSFCVWNAITWERCDERNRPKVEEPDVLQIKKCYRCFRSGFKEIISCKKLGIRPHILPKLWEIPYKTWSKGIYNGVECIFALEEKSWKVIDDVHFTTLAAWNFFVDVYYDIDQDNYFRRITRIEDDRWLYADWERLIVYETLPLKKKQSSFLSRPSGPTQVFWSSFCSEGSHLATCTSDGCINIWNVATSQVEQRFKYSQGESFFACCWSGKFLLMFQFFEKIPSLSKYPVDRNLKVQLFQNQQVPLTHLVHEFESFTTVVDFSEGLLIFQCGSKPVKVINVSRVEGPVAVTLPGIESLMNITVSPGALFVFGGNYSYSIWKRNAKEPTVYEIVFKVCPYYPLGGQYECCFGNDSKIALVTQKQHSQPEQICQFIDLDTCKKKSLRFYFGCRQPKLFLINEDRVVLAVSHDMLQIFDLDSGALLGSSFQRYLSKDFLNQARLSPKGTVLTLPKINGYMEFFRLYITQNPLFSDVNRDKAAIRSQDKFKKL